MITINNTNTVVRQIYLGHTKHTFPRPRTVKKLLSQALAPNTVATSKFKPCGLLNCVHW
jgi:hypothetical protein